MIGHAEEARAKKIDVLQDLREAASASRIGEIQVSAGASSVT
jgi:hypothetical protein